MWLKFCGDAGQAFACLGREDLGLDHKESSPFTPPSWRGKYVATKLGTVGCALRRMMWTTGPLSSMWRCYGWWLVKPHAEVQ